VASLERKGQEGGKGEGEGVGAGEGQAGVVQKALLLTSML